VEDLRFTVRIFREGSTYVAHVPELDVSSCGDTEVQARRNIRDPVAAFLETAKQTGNLKEILEESGYRCENGRWIEPELVGVEQMHLGLD
jgi:predicted RNase H-like HicB family nuclease